jgi:hypothetical protein
MKHQLYLLSLFLLPLLLLSPIAAFSQGEERFFMVIKLEQDPDVTVEENPSAIAFKAINITTNLEDYQGGKTTYDLNRTYFWLSNYTMYLSQPFQVSDTINPNTVRTTNYGMEIDLDKIEETYQIESNTLQNITKYIAISPLFIDGQMFIEDLNVTAVLYPNTTAIFEMRQI